MGQKFEKLEQSHIKFIDEQKIFFTGTAANTGLVNVSPKGMDSFRVLSPEKVIWLNYTGSGNETAAHIMQNPRMTIMFCSFEESPIILRIYGQARIIPIDTEEGKKILSLFHNLKGLRQIFELKIQMVQSSCGMGVPFYKYKGERNGLMEWFEVKGEERLSEYRQEKNKTSLDGFPTDI